MIKNNRPALEKRLFRSEVIEDQIKEISSYIVDKDLSRLFINCFPNTLDTTVYYRERNAKDSTYIVTGDIPAMWLRDSTAQLWPYLDFLKQDARLIKLFRGLINKQAKCICLDPYANAFKRSRSGEIRVFEQKWELDSLMYFIRLSYFYWKKTHDISVFNKEWERAIEKIIQTIDDQSNPETMPAYKYRTADDCPEILNLVGFGNPVINSYLIRSAFRPSDDATIFQYHIPSNCFAVTSLQHLAKIYKVVFQNYKKAKKFSTRARKIKHDIKKYGIITNKEGKKLFAYEVDGFGGQLLMDDANAPSLLSLPYFKYLDIADEVYQNTREFILSTSNPYYFKAKNARGIGSSHTNYGNIWPMGVIMQAITSNNSAEIKTCLKILLKTHANKYFMHESFSKNNPNNFTRDWFAWANSLFGELILKIYAEDKKILTAKL